MTTLDRFHGRVLDVDITTLGDELAADAPIGATSITVYDAGPFDEDGGHLRIGGATGEVLPYTTWDDETGVITLDAPTETAWPTGTTVDVFDFDAGAACAEWTASVLLDDSADGDPDTATIAHSLIDALADGVRSVVGESVVLQRERNASELELVDVLGKVLVRDITTATAATPAAPEDLAVTSGVYLVGTRHYARIQATWSEVTTNLDGDVIDDVDHYDIQTKPGPPADTASNWGGDYQTPVGTTDVLMFPFDVGHTYSVRVRAVTALGIAGPWCDPVSTLAEGDDEAPGVPSTPVATSRLGTIRVQWDGLTETGGLMPADFDYVEVHASTSPGFTATPGATSTVLGRLYQSGYHIMSVGPNGYNTIWYFRLVAFDTSGNASGQSAIATTEVKPLVDVSNFPDDAMQVLYARTGHFIDLTAANFSANLVTADFIDLGSLYGQLITGLQIQTDYGATTGVKIKNTGIEAYGGGVRTFYIDAATGAVEIRGSLTSGSSINGATVTGSTVRTSSGSTRIELNSGGLYAYASGTETLHLTNDGFMTLRRFLNVVGHSGGQSLVVTDGITAGSGNPAANCYFPNVNVAGVATFDSTCFFNGIATNTNATVGNDIRILGTNSLVKITSSERYKRNIRPADLDAHAILSVESSRYEDHLTGETGIGFIAERLHEAGLTDFVIYDDQGRPETVPYPGWVVAQQAALQHLYALTTEQRDVIDDLRERVTHLEAA